MECIFAHPSLSIFEWCDMTPRYGQGAARSNEKSLFSGHTDGVDCSFTQQDNNKDFALLNFGQIRKFKLEKYNLRVLIWVKTREINPAFLFIVSKAIKNSKKHSKSIKIIVCKKLRIS